MMFYGYIGYGYRLGGNFSWLFITSYCVNFAIVPILESQNLKISKGYSEYEGQTRQWPKEKRQKDKQRSTKHYT